jgi:transcriptional regulator with XRE-family HTH domain
VSFNLDVASVAYNRPAQGIMKRIRRAAGPDPIDVAVGASIRLRRLEIGMSQTQLADAVGTTFQQVQKYEKGTNRISVSRLVRAASALGVSVASLVGEDGTSATKSVITVDLATTEARQLLEAFAAMRSGEARRALVKVAQSVARKTRHQTEERSDP